MVVSGRDLGRRRPDSARRPPPACRQRSRGTQHGCAYHTTRWRYGHGDAGERAPRGTMAGSRHGGRPGGARVRGRRPGRRRRDVRGRHRRRRERDGHRRGDLRRWRDRHPDGDGLFGRHERSHLSPDRQGRDRRRDPDRLRRGHGGDREGRGERSRRVRRSWRPACIERCGATGLSPVGSPARMVP